jgi:predicted RNA binding protein YcfA (HicA-like mRNA interferase family)
MPPVPILTPQQVVKTFERLGWRVVRQRGSHIILAKKGAIFSLSVPKHSEVARGTLRGLINQAGLTVEAFLEALEK